MRGKEADFARVYPIGCITKGQKGEELAEMVKMKEAGIVAVSDDGHPVMNSGVMRNAMEYAKTFNLLILDHAEDSDVSGDGVVNEGVHSTIAGLRGINRAAEEIGIARDIVLAEALDARVHICHVSTAGGVELIREAKARNVKVTCETCPQYFSATDEEILSYNTNAKINPPSPRGVGLRRDNGRTERRHDRRHRDRPRAPLRGREEQGIRPRALRHGGVRNGAFAGVHLPRRHGRSGHNGHSKAHEPQPRKAARAAHGAHSPGFYG